MKISVQKISRYYLHRIFIDGRTYMDKLMHAFLNFSLWTPPRSHCAISVFRWHQTSLLCSGKHSYVMFVMFLLDTIRYDIWYDTIWYDM